MTVFNEKSHAFMAAKYYEYLLEEFQERGRKAFVHGTQYYSGQRGRRMAQRAIRDGKDLTYETYSQYGEWKNTEEIKEEGVANARETVTECPHYVYNMTKCPWRAQFEQMGSTEAGIEYCSHLDNSIARGFNPYLYYDVDLSNMEDKEVGGYCIHTIKDVSADEIDMTNRPENLISFEYHCAHSYWAFREVVSAIFGIEGEKVATKVLDDFAKEYGEDAAETIFEYRDTNFNVTY